MMSPLLPLPDVPLPELPLVEVPGRVLAPPERTDEPEVPIVVVRLSSRRLTVLFTLELELLLMLLPLGRLTELLEPLVRFTCGVLVLRFTVLLPLLLRFTCGVLVLRFTVVLELLLRFT